MCVLLMVLGHDKISDHYLVIVSYEEERPRTKKPFQFCNGWTKHPSFLEKVNTRWDIPITGYIMFCAVRRLKLEITN